MGIDRVEILLRLPAELGEWVKAQARDDGLSVNAWATVKLMALKQESER